MKFKVTVFKLNYYEHDVDEVVIKVLILVIFVF